MQKDEQADKLADETTEKKVEEHTSTQMEDKTEKRANTHAEKKTDSVNLGDVRPPKKEHRCVLHYNMHNRE